MTDHDQINITDAATGESRTGQRRRGAQMMKNGQRSNDYVQSAIRTFDLIKAAALMLSAVGAVVLGIVQWFALPQMERVVREAVAPINARLSENTAATENVAKDTDAIRREQWTIIDQKIYMARLREVNRGMNVPEPERWNAQEDRD